jgi:hypothetical protein
MKHQKTVFLILTFLLFGSQFLVAQIENKKKGTTITIKATTTIKNPSPLTIDTTKGFKNAYKNSKSQRIKAEQEKALKNKGIITPEMLAKQRFNKNIERSILNFPMIDMDLGSFRTKSKNINVSSYDFGLEDGDVISIFKNGILIIENYTLQSTLKIFSIPLDIGFNKIEILAVDEGRYKPNTGAFSIYDDFKEVITTDLWVLAKGAKVIAIIIREE